MSSLLKKLTKRNNFNLTESNGLTMRMGDIVPLYVRHIVPGTSLDIKGYFGARFMPMQAPIMSHCDIKTWGFFIPYRLIWDDYKEFFTQKTKNGDDASPIMPRTDFSGLSDTDVQIDPLEVQDQIRIGTLSDYLDLPHCPFEDGTEEDEMFADILTRLPNAEALEPRAYQLLYNTFFRDQNIDDAVQFGTDSYIYDFRSERAVSEWSALHKIRKYKYAKDYFTSALPTPSMVEDEVNLPVDEIVRMSDNVDLNDDRTFTKYRTNQTLPAPSDNDTYLSPSHDYPQSSNIYDLTGNNGDGLSASTIEPNGSLQIDVGTMREFTYTKMIWQYLLDKARGGSVYYRDFVKTMFNTRVPDYRAEIPEYSGGNSQPVIISEVLQTSETNETAQGNMSGRGTSVGGAHHYYYKASEHGIFMVVGVVMPRASYMSGLPKRHFMFDPFDHYLPQFDHVGDEPIYRKELSYMDPDVNEEVFGYAPRYSVYKSTTDRVHGTLRNSLAYWTMARDFNGRTPVLSPQFLVAEDEVIDRPFFVQADGRYRPEHLTLECSFNVTGWQPMSKDSKPVV